MPYIVLALPTMGEDPWGAKILSDLTSLQNAINNLNGSATPLPLGVVGVAGSTAGPTAAIDHVHPNTGLATTEDLANAVIGAGGVPTGRQITAGDGLIGGGDLSQDRELSVDVGTVAGTVAAGDDSRITGAVQAATTAAATTTWLVSTQLAADLVRRFGIRADGTIAHGEPPIAIAGVAGTSTVTVTTGANHPYASGDIVTIAGVQSFTGANGTFTITRTGAATFTLNSATGSGTYTSGGTVQRVLGGTGSALEGIVNHVADGVRDVVTVRGHHSGTGMLAIYRDYLGQPIFVVPQAGGPAVLGDDLRVFAGADIFNPEVHLRSDGSARLRKGDPASGVGVLALGNATTAPSTNPDGTHTVNGSTTAEGAVWWVENGRPFVRTSTGHEDAVAFPHRRVTWGSHAQGNGTAMLNMLSPAPTAAGTASTADDPAGNMILYTTAGTTDSDGGLISTAAMTRARVAPIMYAKIRTDNSDITSTRIAVGLVSAEIASNAGPASTGAYTTAAGAWLRYDSGVDGTAFWRAVSSDATTATVTTTTAAIAAGTVYELRVEINTAGTSIRYWVGSTLVATHTTNLPSAAGGLTWITRVRTLTNAARSMRVSRVLVNQE